MPSTRDRERKLARAKIERQQARRAQKIRAQRQMQARIGAGAIVVLLVLGVGWGTHWFGIDSPKKTVAAECTWTPAAAGNTNLKDVGTPPTSDIPLTGVEPMTITTSQGVIPASLDVTQAPCTAASFSYLSGKGFFNNTTCHRLSTGAGLYMLQCGDPSGTGQGGPKYTIEDENLPVSDPNSGASAATSVVYKAGTLAVANTGSPNTGSSQFFLVYKDSMLPPSYSVFGTIAPSGIDVLNKVAAGGVGAGGASATDGPPKLVTTIQSMTIGKAVPAPTASPNAPTSTPPTTGTSPTPSAPSSSKS